MAGSAKRGDGNAPAVKESGGNGDAARQSNENDGPGLDRVIQAQIGDKLRAMYGGLVDQPVPDRLASLIDQLSRPAGDRS